MARNILSTIAKISPSIGKAVRAARRGARIGRDTVANARDALDIAEQVFGAIESIAGTAEALPPRRRQVEVRVVEGRAPDAETMEAVRRLRLVGGSKP